MTKGPADAEFGGQLIHLGGGSLPELQDFLWRKSDKEGIIRGG